MKIAVTYENGMVFQHFGHTEQFKVYTVEDGALAGFLQLRGVDTLICGGIGGGAQMALEGAGIHLCAGVQGPADAAVQAYLDHTLQYVTQAQCDHHDHHGAGHDCGHGGHSCGESCHS